ncbi:MAG: HEAT repeat domain-containing protein [Candidatus Sumerlaeaceae bacterium]|nr:HEAT repeat domain-containing protein [Candidatus Sumerlaeaceae bacterium]
MASVQAIEEALRHGKVEAAHRLAAEWLHPRDTQAERAAEVGRLLKALYDDFVVAPIHEFYDKVIPVLPVGSQAAVQAAVKPDIDRTQTWARRLAALANERLANQLADAVKANEMSAAEQVAAALFGSAQGAEDLAMRARQAGNILGGLIHERSRAEALLRTISRAPHKFGLDGALAADMEEEFQRAAAAAVRRERSVGATARVELTQTVVELSRALPGRMAIHEPNPEDFARFREEAGALMRAGLASVDQTALHEVTLLLVEFAPKALGGAGAMAGVEARLHSALGRTARLVSAQILQELGANRNVFTPYLAFARKNIRTRIGRYAVEVLGLFQNPEAVPFLVQCMSDKAAGVRAEAELALGAVGGDKALHTLLSALKADMSARVVEGEQRRDALNLLTALGRSARAMPADQRSRLIAQVVKIIPRDDSEFIIRILLNYFLGKLDGFDPAIIEWAAKTAVAALWKIELPELARRASSSPLGFRQPLIDLLERLMPLARRTVHEAVLENSRQYNGAYLAVAELYAKVPDPSNLEVLRQLVFNAVLHEPEQQRSAYAREMVADPAADERVELTKDKVMASLLHAVDKIGTEESEDFLSEIFQKVQSRQFPSLGGETASMIMDAHMRAAKRRGQSAFAPPGAAAPATQPVVEAPVTEDDMRLLADLDASFFFAAKRRARRVAAMAGLAQRRIVAALPKIIAHLTDKDAIVAAAAATALLDFGGAGASAHARERLFDALLGVIVKGDNATRVKAAEVLRKLGPDKSPLRDRLEELASDPVLAAPARAIVLSLAAGPPKPKAAEAGAGQAAKSESETVDPSINKYLPSKGAGANAMSELDKKRAYMLARQEWIRGGKKGPEPKMPD